MKDNKKPVKTLGKMIDKQLSYSEIADFTGLSERNVRNFVNDSKLTKHTNSNKRITVSFKQFLQGFLSTQKVTKDIMDAERLKGLRLDNARKETDNLNLINDIEDNATRTLRESLQIYLNAFTASMRQYINLHKDELGIFQRASDEAAKAVMDNLATKTE